MKFSWVLVACALALSFAEAWVHSQETEQPSVQPTVQPTEQPVAQPKKSRGKKVREKEAEGSEAPNRFEADTVIKSKYERNGQSLEVDPD